MGYFFNSLGFANANIMTVFVFAVQLIAVLTNHRTYSMIAAVLSVLIFNFLFTTPRYTFHAYGEGYPVTFLIMFGIAFLTGTLALKLKNQAKQSEMVAFRTKILFDTNQILQCARGREEIISKTGQQLRKLLGRNVIFYSVKDHELEKSKVFMMEDREWSEQQKLKRAKEMQKLKKEKYVAEWVLKHRKRAGAGTGNFPGAECLYLTVGVNETVYGVLGISIEKKQLESFEKSILQAIIGECALALENEQITIEKEKAAILAKNEQLRSNLLRAISHDLRTPLTAIITYTDLLKNETDPEKQKEYIEVLERKSFRLKVLIEDLFEISKAASKSVKMNYMQVDLVGLIRQVELENDSKIQDAKLEFRWKLPDHKVIMWLDSEKTYRIFENLIVNITKYAMAQTRVYIEMKEFSDKVSISMKNVSATELDFDVNEITDRFVRGDSSRNTEGSGLGLAIAKSFIELQHGTLQITTEADLFKAEIVLPRLSEGQTGQTEV